MNKADRDYYSSRRAAEEAAARQAKHPQAADSHKKLAQRYAALADDQDDLEGR